MVSKLPFAMCASCTLNDSRAPVPGCGPKDASVIIIGEAPGVNEEAQGIPFVGQSGQFLDIAIQRATDDKVTIGDIYRTNVVACRPDNNREPSWLEIESCRPRLEHELAGLMGKRVLALGNTAHGAMGLANQQRGVVYPIGERLVMPAWHPAYILRKPDEASEFLAQVKLMFSEGLRINPIPWPEPRWMHSVQELQEALSQCPDGSWVAFDLETDQVQYYDTAVAPADPILMMQLAWTEDFALIIDDEMLYDTEGVIDVLQEFFDRVSVCGHNNKFDVDFVLSQLGLRVHQDFDTMLAHYCLDENLPHGLKPIATMEFGIPDYEKETIGQYLRTRNDKYSKVPAPALAKYGAMDAVVTLKVREVLEQRLLDEGLYQWPFMNVHMRAANGLVEVEMRGMQVDQEQLEKVHDAFQVKIDALEEEIRTCVDEPGLNIRSTQQMAELLYDKLGMPEQRGRKIKPRSTNKDVLAKVKDFHPVIPMITEYRRVTKMQSSYVDNLIAFIGLDGRVHADFRIPGTEVGRLSVADPALQTIPRPGDYYGALIRSLFVARPGYKIVVVDYSQAELRVFTVISGEPFLLKVYQDGRDLHTEVAVAMFGQGFTKEQRVLCKMFNFSYIYGGSEYSFAQDSGLNITVARQFVRDYNRLMPVALEFKQKQLETLKRQGYVSTVFGRRRHFPLITMDNVEDARKAAVHMPCAGTASDLTLLSALDAQDEGIPVVLAVHDSVLAECREDLAEAQGQRIAELMEANGKRFLPQVPWKVDVEVGDRWAKMPELR